LIREYEKGRITDRELLSEVRIEDIHKITHSARVDGDHTPLARGESNGLGMLTGKLCCQNDYVDADSKILFIENLDPKFVRLMSGCNAVISAEGGVASHAGVIATTKGIPLVTGCGGGLLNDGGGIEIKIGKRIFKLGDEITVDSNSGNIYSGRVASVLGRDDPGIKVISGVARKILQRKNLFYEVQTLDSLKTAVKNENKIVYGIDAELLRATGCIRGKPIESRVNLGKSLRRSAMELAYHLSKVNSGVPLCIRGSFDRHLDYNTCPSNEVRCIFLKHYAKAAGDTLVISHNKDLSFEGYETELPNNIKIVNFDEFSSLGNNLVRLWAQDEDLIALAKAEVANVG
jgi:phosphoenolpyruvate synthase/pyruvate phosphate dikinase